jgi:hypothetical protein
LESSTAATEASGAGWRTESPRARRPASRRPLGVASTPKTSTKATGAPPRYSTAALYVDEDASVLNLDAIGFLISGLHVFFALIHNKRVAALSLLGGSVGRRSDVFDNTDALDRTVAAKFAFEVVRSDTISETGDEECFEGITLHFGIFARFVYAA